MKRLFLILLLMAYPAHAKICTENNLSNCESLGYTAESCVFGGVACPYDTSKWLCSRWSCADGRYYNQPQTNYECIEVKYKGLTCYDCFMGCTKEQLDSDTCWRGNQNLF